MRNKYIKIAIPYNKIIDILKNQKFKRIIFYIDLQSIAKGLYQKNNIFFEINYYINNGKPSKQLLIEYKNLLNRIYKICKFYSPFFITFYDDGINQQNTTISSNYKGGRSTFSDFLENDDDIKLFKKIKKNYFLQIEQYFNKPNLSKVYYLKEYESDLIPYYVIKNDLFNSKQPTTLNVILSNDKDLLQTCKFKNTIQVTNRFFPSKLGKKQLGMDIYNNKTAIQYIYKNFKIGNLTAEYIPLLLSLIGDKADKILGLKGVGPAKAIKLIETYDLPPEIYELKQHSNLPKIISENLDLIIQNYQLISFDEQLQRTSI